MRYGRGDIGEGVYDVRERISDALLCRFLWFLSCPVQERNMTIIFSYKITAYIQNTPGILIRRECNCIT